MDLVKTITKNVKLVLNNKIEEQAIENMLYAKVAHLFSLKGIKFTSINNLKKPATLAYYAVNFINSGGSKNQAINTLDDCVLPFLADEYYRLEREIAGQMLDEEIDNLYQDKSFEKEKAKLKKKYANTTVIDFKTNGGTQAALYSKLEKIEKYHRGALLSQMTEFSDYYRASVENIQSVNRGFMDCLNNLYEGLFEPSDSMGVTRHEIKGVPFSLLFMSDIEELLEPKNNENFKRRLKSGFARRMNFYINKDVNYSKNPPERVSKADKLGAYDKLTFCSSLIKKAYDDIPADTVLIFDDKANEALEQWSEYCNKEVSAFYKYNDRLTLENNIKKVDIEHSTWKITKMAAIIQLLEGGKLPFVTYESVFKAIDFYKKCRSSLYALLDEHKVIKEADFANYLLENLNKPVSRAMLREQSFTPCDNYFSKWYSEAISIAQDILNEKGFEIVKVACKGNGRSIMCQKMIKPEDVPINVSYSNSDEPHPAHGYEYAEVSTEAFKSLILNSKALSAQQFKDGHRNIKNCMGVQNTIWLDFDDGLTLEQAQKKFKDYWYVIYTSMNHQKAKHGVVCDRFRVVLKTKEPLPSDKEKYEAVMDKIIGEVGADRNCHDISRYYRANADAEIFVNTEGEFFDWSGYSQESEEKKTIPVKKNEDICYGGLSDNTLFTDYGSKILKSEEIAVKNRDKALAYSVGVLISAVKTGNLSHSNALRWLDDKLNSVMTPDFKGNARKYRKRLEKLEF